MMFISSMPGTFIKQNAINEFRWDTRAALISSNIRDSSSIVCNESVECPEICDLKKKKTAED